MTEDNSGITYIVSTQVGLEFSSKDFESCAFPNTIGSDKAENLTGSRSGEPMQFESVGSITVGYLRLEVSRKIDDSDGFKWTPYTNYIEQRETEPAVNSLLYTNTTADT